MYKYEVYDFDYDDTKSFELLHKVKFTKEEYETIVNTCRMKIRAKIQRNKKILKRNDISEKDAEKFELWTCTGDWDVFENIRKIMIKEYGFVEKQKPLFTYTLHGCSFINNKTIENRIIE